MKADDFFYEHADGSVHRKPALVVEMGGGPAEYFNSPFVKRWWQGEDPREQAKRTAQ